MDQATNAVTNIATHALVGSNGDDWKGLLFVVAFAVMGLLSAVVWVWMLVDAVRNPRLSVNERVMWVLVIVFLNTLGAIVYYFIGRRGSTA